MVREWDITQWVNLRPGKDSDKPGNGLSFMSYASMGPNIPKGMESGEGWLIERCRPDDSYRPRPNVGDPAYLNSLVEATLPALGRHRLFVRFVSDTTDRQAQTKPPRNADIVDWLNMHCSGAVEVVWGATMLSAPFGGLVLIALHREDDFVLTKLRFNETILERE